jgi:hypothetical protein
VLQCDHVAPQDRDDEDALVAGIQIEDLEDVAQRVVDPGDRVRAIKSPANCRRKFVVEVEHGVGRRIGRHVLERAERCVEPALSALELTLPGVLRAAEWGDLTDRLAGDLGVVLVHGSPQRLNVVEPLRRRLDDLDLGRPCVLRGHAASLRPPTDPTDDPEHRAGDSGHPRIPADGSPAPPSGAPPTSKPDTSPSRTSSSGSPIGSRANPHQQTAPR